MKFESVIYYTMENASSCKGGNLNYKFIFRRMDVYKRESE